MFQAAYQGHGGEVFVLDMGSPVRIRDLAEKLVRLNGFEPYRDIEIVFTGLPGKCTINIYSSNGNFVHKIEHTDGSGKEDWDLRTEFNQYIVSDVYIYTVESDLGKHVDKFIVVR